MADYELDRLLVQVRRIEEHREKGAEKEIRETYQELLKELRHYLADTYSQYAEDDRLDYGILQRHSAYARFLEEVEKKINDISPEVKRLIRGTVDQTYEYTYNGMVDCVQRAAKDITAVSGLKACTPDVIRRAVENPVSKLTLNDRLEKHRKEIIYDIKQNIGVGLMNGDRYSTMANRIKKSVEGDYKKAIRIARTETHRVREEGNHDAAVAADEVLKTGESGMRMAKTWRTMKDERVRPAKAKGKNRKYDHRKMDGVTVLVDEEFVLPSGAKTMAPGQSGVAGEDINCRCYLSYGLQEVKAISEKIEMTMSMSGDKITDEDEYYINQAISFQSYPLNEKLRAQEKLTDAEHELVRGIDRAIMKLPDYQGTVYRSVGTQMMPDVSKYDMQHQPGSIITYHGYTSASLEIYDESMEYQLVIRSKHGKNMTAYNDAEKEVIFKRGTMFYVSERRGNIIYMEEL